MTRDTKPLLCWRCKAELEKEQVSFRYLGHTFHTELPRCPLCGEVFIPEELARGRMAEVEKELEDK